MNFKRFRRLYRLANLQIAAVAGEASEIRPRHAAATRERAARYLDDGLFSDRLLHGRRFRVDTCSTSAVAIHWPSIFGILVPERVVVRHARRRRAGARLSEMPAHRQRARTHCLCRTWADEHGVELLFIQPGKPTQNAFIESFNARVRDELLTPIAFGRSSRHVMPPMLGDVRYNAGHPHSALGEYDARGISFALMKLRPLHRNRWPHDGTYPTLPHAGPST